MVNVIFVGGNLRKKMSNLPFKTGLTECKTLAYARQLLAAETYMNSKDICHGDIKGNILSIL